MPGSKQTLGPAAVATQTQPVLQGTGPVPDVHESPEQVGKGVSQTQVVVLSVSPAVQSVTQAPPQPVVPLGQAQVQVAESSVWPPVHWVTQAPLQPVVPLRHVNPQTPCWQVGVALAGAASQQTWLQQLPEQQLKSWAQLDPPYLQRRSADAGSAPVAAAIVPTRAAPSVFSIPRRERASPKDLAIASKRFGSMTHL